ncbi:MAG: hypothetical protein GY854_07225 [Deltaproteobacteria bacterium]|nr:hypothetical protein [Deltaproteobacteria bacterium]
MRTVLTFGSSGYQRFYRRERITLKRILQRPFSLDEMLLAILGYYKQIGLDSTEMVDDLRHNGLKTPEDVVRTLLGLKEIGSPISLSADSKSAAAVTIVKQLFPEQNEG